MKQAKIASIATILCLIGLLAAWWGLAGAQQIPPASGDKPTSIGITDSLIQLPSMSVPQTLGSYLTSISVGTGLSGLTLGQVPIANSASTANSSIAFSPTSLANALVQMGAGGFISAGIIPATSVTAGAYTNANVTVGADGRVTAASNGVAGGNSGMTAGQVGIAGSATTITSSLPVSQTGAPSSIVESPASGPLPNSLLNVGTSGATLGLLNANKTDIGNNIYSGNNTLSGNNTISGTNNDIGAERSGPCALTASATISLTLSPPCASNGANGLVYNTVTLTSNATFALPILPAGFQIFGIRINHGGSAFSAIFATGYVFPSGQLTSGQPMLCTSANCIDDVWCHTFNGSEVDCNLQVALTAVSQSSETWNGSHKSANITLSNGNLSATQTAGGGNNSSVFGTGSFSTGKYYWQVTPTFAGGANSEVVGIGLTTAQTGNNNFIGDTSADGVGYLGNGPVWYNGSAIATIAAFTTGTAICVAVDYANANIWFQPIGSGKWNNDVIANQSPSGNVGGISISSLTSAGTKAIAPGASTQFANDLMAANFSNPCSGVSGGLSGFTTLP